jgi:glycosyltransferase involved in cell wall biosynthesis
MNLVLVSQEYPPETARGGIGSQTLAKAGGLAAMGHKVFVISRSLDADRHERSSGNICVIRVPGLEDRLADMTNVVQWLAHSFVIAAEITALQKRVGVDIIDFPEWGAEGYVYLLNRTAWNNIPAVVHLHGPLVMLAHTMNWPEVDSEFYRYGTGMEAACVQLADAVYSSSECSSQWIKKHYNLPGRHIPTIHTGVDTELFAPDKADKSEHPLIVFAGKFVENKGIYELVEAAGRLVKDYPDLRLRMIGRAEANVRENLQTRAGKSGAAALLEFSGYLGREDLARELARAHIFAAPSYYEGGPGFVYLEAMACGLPVIGGKGSGVDEIVTSGENGLLVAPGDVGSLEQAFGKLLSDSKLRTEMGARARRYVVEKADSRICLKRLEEFYHFVIKGREADGGGQKL